MFNYSSRSSKDTRGESEPYFTTKHRMISAMYLLVAALLGVIIALASLGIVHAFTVTAVVPETCCNTIR